MWALDKILPKMLLEIRQEPKKNIKPFYVLNIPLP